MTGRTWVRHGAVVAAALLAGGCFWTAPGEGPDRRAHNARETAITAQTVTGLSPAWVARVDEGPVGDPVTSVGAVHVNDTRSTYGFAATTGGRLWEYGVAEPNTMNQPFVSGDRVVVSMSAGAPVYYGARVEVAAATGNVVVGEKKGRVAAVRGSNMLLFRDEYTSPGLWPYGLEVIDAAGNLMCCSGYIGAGSYLTTLPSLTLGPAAALHGGVGANADLPLEEPGAWGNGVRAYVLGNSRSCRNSLAVCPNWARPLPGTTTTAPLLTSDGATAVVGTDTGHVVAVDTASGALRWTASLGSAVTDTPALAHGMLFVPTAEGTLVALAAGGCGATTCAPRWWAATGSRITQQPAVAGDVVFTGSANGALRAFRATGCGSSSCSALWSASTGSEITGAPAIDSGRLYVGTADGRLLAYAL